MAFDPTSVASHVNPRRVRHLPQSDHRESPRTGIRRQPAVCARRAGTDPDSRRAGARVPDAESQRVADLAQPGPRLRRDRHARAAAMERQRAARDSGEYEHHARVRRQPRRSPAAAARHQSGRPADACRRDGRLRIAGGHADALERAGESGLRSADERQHGRQLELSLVPGRAESPVREGHPVAGVVHVVQMPGHLVRKFAVRGRPGRDQPVRPQLRRRPVPDRSHAQPASERRLSAAVRRQSLRRRLAGVDDCQRGQRHAVQPGDRLRSVRAADGRPASRTSARAVRSTRSCQAASSTPPAAA